MPHWGISNYPLQVPVDMSQCIGSWQLLCRIYSPLLHPFFILYFLKIASNSIDIPLLSHAFNRLIGHFAVVFGTSIKVCDVPLSLSPCALSQFLFRHKPLKTLRFSPRIWFPPNFMNPASEKFASSCLFNHARILCAVHLLFPRSHFLLVFRQN